MLLILRTLLSGLIGLILWIVTRIIQEAAEVSLPIAVLSGLAGFLGFLFSYMRHRDRCDDLAYKALRIANTPGKTDQDWQGLLDESDQPWKRSLTLLSVFVGLSAWLITSLISLLSGTDNPAVIHGTNIMLSFLGNIFCHYAKKDREMKQFERTLAAANEGRWSPPSEDPEADKSLGGKAKERVSELPEKLVDAALEGFEEGLK